MKNLTQSKHWQVKIQTTSTQYQVNNFLTVFFFKWHITETKLKIYMCIFRKKKNVQVKDYVFPDTEKCADISPGTNFLHLWMNKKVQ